MKPLLVCLLSLALLSAACAKKEHLLVILPGADGQLGAIELHNNKGTGQLATTGQGLYATDRNSPPTGKAISEQELQTIFGEALAARPTPPKQFIFYFQFDSPRLTPESNALLPDVLATVKERASRDIVVIGHTDRVGPPEYNQTLALQRAQLVTDMLREKGAEPATIQTLSHGEGNLLIPTADEVAEPRNRRVEVTIR